MGYYMVPIEPDLGKLLHDHEHIANVVMFESRESRRRGMVLGGYQRGRRIGIVVVVSRIIFNNH